MTTLSVTTTGSSALRSPAGSDGLKRLTRCDCGEMSGYRL